MLKLCALFQTLIRFCVDFSLCGKVLTYEGVGESWGVNKTKFVCGKTNAPVNVRERASISGRIITKLPKGAEVKMTGKSVKNGGYTWAEILYNGKTCYCDKQWINC